jgi:hypothetical protein
MQKSIKERLCKMKEPKKAWRSLSFRVVDADKKVIVAIPFDTPADDLEIAAYVKSSIEGIAEMRRMAEARPEIDKLYRGQAQRFTLILRNDLTNEQKVVITISGRGADTLEGLRAKYIASTEAAYKGNLQRIYHAMVAYMRHKKWRIETITPARWREVCHEHPLYGTFWDEKRKQIFETTAKASITKGLKRRLYKMPSSRTGGVSSTQITDETPPVRQSSKSSK